MICKMWGVQKTWLWQILPRVPGLQDGAVRTGCFPLSWKKQTKKSGTFLKTWFWIGYFSSSLTKRNGCRDALIFSVKILLNPGQAVLYRGTCPAWLHHISLIILQLINLLLSFRIQTKQYFNAWCLSHLFNKFFYHFLKNKHATTFVSEINKLA